MYTRRVPCWGLRTPHLPWHTHFRQCRLEFQLALQAVFECTRNRTDPHMGGMDFRLQGFMPWHCVRVCLLPQRCFQQLTLRRAHFSAPLFFWRLFFWRPFILAQERKKAATRTWRDQDPKPQKECWVATPYSLKKSIGLQNPKP